MMDMNQRLAYRDDLIEEYAYTAAALSEQVAAVSSQLADTSSLGESYRRFLHLTLGAYHVALRDSDRLRELNRSLTLANRELRQQLAASEKGNA